MTRPVDPSGSQASPDAQASGVAAVEVSDLTVVYGEHEALRQVSFVLPKASTLAVIGPSGCGKTTLLRAVAGVEPAASGTVTIDGVDRTTTPPHQRRVGLMFQDHALFPHLDVAANVAFGLKMQHRSADAIAERTVEVLELVGLEGFGRRRVETLSGGEAQRVALARALAPSPEVLLLDEPLGSLDRALREELVTELRSLFSALGLAVIHVTHDQQEAFALGHQVMVLREGSVEQIGPPAEVWRRPASASVASFLGHPNIWPHPDGAVLAPIPSLRIMSDAERGADRGHGKTVDAVVVDVEFREGRYRVTAVEQRPVAEPARRFVVDTDRALRLSQHVEIVIDESALVSLPS